jgi:spore maturation protein SpmB
LISTTGLVLLRKGGASNPTAVIGPAIVATVCGLVVGLLVLRVCQRWSVFAVRDERRGEGGTAVPAAAVEEAEPEKLVAPVSLSGWRRAVLAAFFGVLGWGLVVALGHAGFAAAWSAGNWGGAAAAFMMAASGLVLPGFLTFFILYAALAGLRVFEVVVDGAKEGIQTVLRIIPYLVGMIVGVGVLRASGTIDALAGWLRDGLKISGAIPDLLPMVLMRPLSGSGSQAVLANLIDRFGADSYEAMSAATMYGSTETTFYVLAVYFGAVGIRRIRHALMAGLVADLVAMSTALFLCQWLIR